MAAINFAFAAVPTRATIVPELFGIADAYEEEEHEVTVSVSQYPIETGADLTDHAQKEPEKLTLTGVVSNLNVPSLGGIAPSFLDKPPLVWNAIKLIAGLRRPGVVITTLGIYENMLLHRARTRVDGSTGLQALRFELGFVEVLFEPTEEQGDVLSPLEDGPAGQRVGTTNSGGVLSGLVTPSEYLSRLL